MLTPQTLQTFIDERFGALLAQDSEGAIGWRQWTAQDTADLFRWLEQQNAAQGDDVECLNQKQAASKVGVAPATFRNWMRRRDHPVPHIRDGERILVPTFLLKEWLREEADRAFLAGLVNGAGWAPEGQQVSYAG